MAYWRLQRACSIHFSLIDDEAQNATPSQLKMFLTRMGRNAKFIITGDITQIDLPRHQSSGLVQATHILKGIDSIEVIELDNSDVVRHRLVTRIIRAYERNAEEISAKNNTNNEAVAEDGTTSPDSPQLA